MSVPRDGYGLRALRELSVLVGWNDRPRGGENDREETDEREEGGGMERGNVSAPTAKKEKKRAEKNQETEVKKEFKKEGMRKEKKGKREKRGEKI